MIISDILSIPSTSPGFEMMKSMYNYFGLKDYISFRFNEVFNRERINDIYAYKYHSTLPGDQYFWEKILSGQLLKGDHVRLFNFQVSPWFPRKPGTYWTYNAAMARKEALNHIENVDEGTIILDIWGKTLMSEFGGIGSVNMRKDRESVLFTLTASGHTDRGIPIVCSQRIWKDIETALKNDVCVEIDMKGIITSIPLEYDSYFLRSSGIPKIAIALYSSQNIEIKASNLKILVSPWTIFEIDSNQRPYGFTFKTHNLIEDDLEKSTNWIKKYVKDHNGKVILTDFDEEANSLNSRFPLNNCLDGSILNEDIMEYLQNIEYHFMHNTNR